MLTYTGSRTNYGIFTNNSSTTNLSLGDTLINQYTLELVHRFPFLFGEQTFILQTFPSQQFYTPQLQIRKIMTVQINVGNTGGSTTTGAGFNWPVKESPSMQHWNNLNLTNNISSDIPQYFIYYAGQLGIYPKPAAGYNPITIRAQMEVTGSAIADYTTGTIVAIPYALTLTATPAKGDLAATLTGNWTLPTGTYQMIFSSGDTILVTLTNGSTTVTWTQPLTAAATTAITVRTASGGDIITGSGTTWVTSMNGYVFSITEATGDGFWYKIDTVYSTTKFSIVGAYQGASIAAGSAAYTIGQSSIIPPAYQFIPVYRAAEFYYTIIAKDETRMNKFKQLADIQEKFMRDDYGNKSTNPTIEDGDDKPIINPNLTVNITGSSTNQ